MHHCPHCSRPYQRKVYFDRHIAVCEILCKSKRERGLEVEEQSDTPTVRDLYKVVMELAVKYSQLEQKYQEMAKINHVQTRKMDFAEELHANYANALDFTAWFNTLIIEREHLELLFQTDYVRCVVAVLKSHLDLLGEDKKPIRANPLKENAFYIFDIEKKHWTIMDDEIYLKLMHYLDKKVMSEFIKWQTENRDNMYLDDFSLQYAKNVKKIMVIRELAYSRIKRGLLG